MISYLKHICLPFVGDKDGNIFVSDLSHLPGRQIWLHICPTFVSFPNVVKLIISSSAFILECHHKGELTLGNPKALNFAFTTVMKTLLTETVDVHFTEQTNRGYDCGHGFSGLFAV